MIVVILIISWVGIVLFVANIINAVRLKHKSNVLFNDINTTIETWKNIES